MHIKTFGRTIAVGLAGVCLSALLRPAFGQDFPSSLGQAGLAQPPRARQLLKNARELYAQGEYDAAAQLYQQVDSVKETLTPNERADLGAQMMQNATAQKGRADGLTLVESAEKCLVAGRASDADGYLRLAQANQFLVAPADKLRLQTLAQNLNTSRGSLDASGNAATILLHAREALKRGDLDTAEALARQAEKSRSFISGLAFWGDTPARVLEEARIARSRMPKTEPIAVAPKDSLSEYRLPAPKDLGPSTAMDNTSPPTRANVTNYTPLPTADMANGNANPKDKAKQLVLEGYKALEANNLDQAKLLANQAKELRAPLEWWEPNPDKLLADIGRRSTTNEVIANNNDPAALLKQGRSFYLQQRFDEAERLAVQAESHNRRYGLFEDSPKKLRDDIGRARVQLDADRGTKLVQEARRQLKQNNYAEARTLATEAKKLHTQNTSLFNWNDTPDAVLRDVARLEKLNPTPAMPPLPSDIAQASTRDNLESAQMRKLNRERAAALLAEARQLEKQEHLVQARSKALEAQKLSVQWTPMDETPEAVLRDLSTKAAGRVRTLLEQATELASTNPADSTRFQKAENYLGIARQLAEAFRQDTTPIDRKSQWLQLAASQSRNGAMASAPALQSAQGARPGSLEEPSEPELKAKHQDAVQKLEHARLELAAGNVPLARKLAEDAIMVGTVKAEAQKVLRSVDDEEHAQKRVAAQRDFHAGMYAFEHKDFPKAAKLLSTIDVNLLQSEQARKLGEVIMSRDMAMGSQKLESVGSLPPGKDPGIVQVNNTAPGVAGKSSISDAADSQFDAVRAMEKVQADKYRALSLGAQQRAQELVKAGQEAKAIDVLRDYQVQLKDSGLSDAYQVSMNRTVEARIEGIQRSLAQREVDKERDKLLGKADNMETRTVARLKTQEKIADLMKRGNQMYKEGQYDEAIACATKSLDLEPDNPGARALIQLSETKRELNRYNSMQKGYEQEFLDGLRDSRGPRATYDDPVKGDKKFSMNASRRNDSSMSPLLNKSAKEMMIERKLSQPTRGINFLDVPLYRVLQDLNAMSGLNIVPDKAALAAANVSLEQPISLQVEDISLKSVLNLILRQARLTYVIRNEVLEVTTEAEATGKRKTCTYSVADLVKPVEDAPTSVINSFEEAMKRHINSSNGGVKYAPPVPYTPQGGLQNGMPVSQGPAGAGSYVPKQDPNNINQLVINLITTTIAPNSWEQAGGEGRIQYFPLGHALVVSQVQEVQEEVQALLNALRKLQDIQISIEMRVVSVSEKFFERIGLDFDVNFKSPTFIGAANQLQNGNYGPNTGINKNLYVNNVFSGLTPAGTLTPDLGVPIKNSSFDFTIPPFGGYPGTLGADGGLTLGLAFLSDIQVFMLLEAAQGDQRTHIMQAPKITVFNAQTANINVQDQLFFLTSVSIAQAGSQTFFVPQQQPFPVGVGMQVTPVVSADRRFVRLNLVPQITNIISANIPLIPVQIPVPQLFDAPGGQGYISGQPVIFQMFFQQPSFSSINLNTTVNVPDGGTVLLGGLKVLAEGRNEFGPPILSKIPYLNRLFRNQAFGREAESIMVMVTPRIIINEEIEQEILGNVTPIPRQ